MLAFDICQDPRATALGVEYVTKERLLQEADIVSLHCPLLPSTRHMIDANRCARACSLNLVRCHASGGALNAFVVAQQSAFRNTPSAVPVNLRDRIMLCSSQTAVSWASASCARTASGNY